MPLHQPLTEPLPPPETEATVLNSGEIVGEPPGQTPELRDPLPRYELTKALHSYSSRVPHPNLPPLLGKYRGCLLVWEIVLVTLSQHPTSKAQGTTQ